MTIKPDIWKDIPGYEGKYQASYSGEVRRVFASGKTRSMRQFRKTSAKAKKILRERLFVKLTDSDGKAKEVAVLKIMVMTYFGEIPEGKVPYHKNGVVTDNWVSNIGFISRSELGKRTGGISKSKPVIKIDRYGSYIEAYKSARECGRCNHMSYQTVMDYCNLKNKTVIAPDGYIYAWENEKSIKAHLERLRQQLSGVSIIISEDGYDEEPELCQTAEGTWYEAMDM